MAEGARNRTWSRWLNRWDNGTGLDGRQQQSERMGEWHKFKKNEGRGDVALNEGGVT